MKSIRQAFVIAIALLVLSSLLLSSSTAQSSNEQQQRRRGAHSSPPRPTMTPEARALLEQAMAAVCTQQKLDPQSNIPIDEMQARPSLPVHSPEAQAGLDRAQRVLPLAKNLVIVALQPLATEQGCLSTRSYRLRARPAM